MSKVFADLNLIIKKRNSYAEKKQIKKTLLSVGSILGIFQKNPESWFKNKHNDEDIKKIENLIEKRNIARKQKKYDLADEIRKQIIDLGVEINDCPSGVKWNWIRS